MAPLLRIMLGTSLAAAYILTSRSPSSSPRWAFVTTYLAAWSVQFAAWVVWKVFLWPFMFSPLRHLPTPKGGHWLMGQFGKVRDMPTGVPQIEWNNTIPNNGIIRYLGFFNQERLLFTAPEALSEVLSKKSYDFIKPLGLRFSLGRVLGVGVLLAEGDEHRRQRKNLMPAFSFRHVKDLYPLFWRKSAEAVEAMTKQVKADIAAQAEATTEPQGPPPPYSEADPEKANAPDDKDTAVLEVGNWASRVTLDIIGLAGMGQDFHAIEDPNNKLTKTYSDVFAPERPPSLVMILFLMFPWFAEILPNERNNRINEAVRVIRTTCKDLIRTKKEKMARGEQREDVDILSAALESGGFSDENLVDQLMTFLAAGHETTATAMTWAIYLMCCHPDVQKRLRAEIHERLPSIETTPSAVDIDRMPYLNAVCSEVLRYYSPVAMTTRETARDTSVLGQFIPKGTRIFLCPWAVNRSLALWGPDALQFKPERWLNVTVDEKSGETVTANAHGGADSNYSFMTFLHGPRSCIGASFAKAEFACLLAAWVGRFEFALEDETLLDEDALDIKGGITSKPGSTLNVKVRPVQGW